MNNLKEMARIPSGFRLADDWEEKLKKAPTNIRMSTKFNRVLNYLSENPEVNTLRALAMGAYGSSDTAAVNQTIKTLKMLGIVEDTGLTSAPMSKAPSERSGMGLGRPKVTNEEDKQLGIEVVRAFSMGREFTEEQKEWIKRAYDKAFGVSDEELNEIEGDYDEFEDDDLDFGYDMDEFGSEDDFDFEDEELFESDEFDEDELYEEYMYESKKKKQTLNENKELKNKWKRISGL
jgi:hypothetical protein